MNTALWVVQCILAFVFLLAGGMKLFAYDRYKAMSEKNKPSDLTRGLVTFIGVAELAGAIGTILPTAVNMAPWLSGWAAVGLALIMVSAINYHMHRHESPATVAVLFVLATFVAYGRLYH